MTPHRSTTLSLFAERCPAALDHYDRRTPYDRDLYAAGIAAHAILQALAEQPHADPERVAEAVAVNLASKGRSFEGEHEPPLPIDRVNEGRDLALVWNALHPIPEGARPEHGLAVDPRWRPVPYRSPSVRLRGILDLLYPVIEEVDGEPVAGVAHLDYKSAFPAGADDLDSLQMKIQTLLVLAHASEPPALIRQEIGNLRTREVHARTIWLDDEGHALLAGWRREIETAMAAADVQPRQARPGAACLGCPYLHACEPAQALVGPSNAQDEATRYAVLEAERARLRARLKVRAARELIPLPDGFVGYATIEERSPIPSALRDLAQRWHAPPDPEAWDAENAGWLGYIGAIPPTMATLNKLAAVLHPRAKGGLHKPEREALIEALSAVHTAVEFGVHRNIPAPADPGGEE